MGWDRRADNLAAYVSPDFDGFSVFAAYQFDQAAIGAMEAMSAFSANAMYNKDGILIGAAIESLSKGHSDYDPVEETYGESQMGMRFAGKYTAEKFAVAALFQSLSDVDGVADWNATTMGGEAMFQFDPMFAFKVAYFMADPNTDNDDDEYNLLSIGVDHTYAKNVTFYIQYAMMMNGDAQGMGIGGNAFGSYVPYGAVDGDGEPVGGESPTGISVGTYFTF
jgi:predicted porin